MALDYFLRSFRLRSNSPQSEKLQELTASYIGLSYQHEGVYEKALEYKKKAHHIWVEINGDVDHLDAAKYLNNIGISYKSLGDLKNSLIYKEKALNMKRRLYKDEDHTAIATSLFNIGNTYLAYQNFSTALEYYSQSLDMWKRIHGENYHIDIVDALDNISFTYLQLLCFYKSMEYNQQSLAFTTTNSRDSDAANSLQYMSNIFQAQGDLEKAFKKCQESIDLKNKIGMKPEKSLRQLGMIFHKL